MSWEDVALVVLHKMSISAYHRAVISRANGRITYAVGALEMELSEVLRKRGLRA